MALRGDRESPDEELGSSFHAHRERLHRERVLPRLLERDPTLWPEEHRDDAADRLGWLDLPSGTRLQLDAWRALRDEARAEDVESILQVGMGGSSLGAAVFARLLPTGPDTPTLTVCDSTHPEHVRPLLERLPAQRTWLVVATKSGTTAETRALASVFKEWFRGSEEDPDRHSLAVTDAGSALARTAAEWRGVITPPADVGGRFSALSAYGLLLPTLAGIEVEPVLDGASRLLESLVEGDADTVAPLLDISARLAAAAESGWPVSLGAGGDELSGWPGWLEQLLAESLGKDGRGLVPVARGYGQIPARRVLRLEAALGEEPPERDWATDGGHVLRLLSAPAAIGSEMLTWELITALTAWCMGVFPFDQPDVERSKLAARRALTGQAEPAEPPLEAAPATGPGRVGSALVDGCRAWLDAAHQCVYATLQLFGSSEVGLEIAVDALCGTLTRALDKTVTWGYGPRYLHSTGQLHKGGPAVAVVQLLIPPRAGDLAVPGETFGLGELLDAQAAGDAAALVALGRPVLRVVLRPEPELAVRVLEEAVAGMDPPTTPSGTGPDATSDAGPDG